MVCSLKTRRLAEVCLRAAIDNHAAAMEDNARAMEAAARYAARLRAAQIEVEKARGELTALDEEDT